MVSEVGLSCLAAAGEHPERIGLVAEGRPWTYGQLGREVERTLGELAAGGVSSGQPVTLVGDVRLRTVLRLYACLELGAPAVLLHPKWSAEARRRRGAGIVRSLAGWPSTSLSPEELPLAVVHTSGSSDEPRGVVLSRRAFLAAAAASAANLGWHEDDRWCLSLPLAHVGGLSILVRCLAARACAVLDPGPFDPARLMATLGGQRITLLSLVPTQLRDLLELRPAKGPPAHLRAVLLGGAAAPSSLLRQATEHGWPVLTTYGLTEACSQVATQPYGSAASGEQGCGPPLPGVEVRVRRGEVEVRGATLMSGYLPPTPVSPFDAEGWFATGDLGRLDAAGRLHILGRKDRMIVTGGENVQPAEVEGVLESHPAIRQAHVFGVPDQRWGQLVAAALVAAEEPLEDGALAELCAARLATYQRPRRILWLTGLPRLANGKVDHRALGRRSGDLRPLSYQA